MLTERHHGRHAGERHRIESSAEYGPKTVLSEDGYLSVKSGPFQGFQIAVTRCLGHRILAEHGVIPDPSVVVMDCPEEACCLVVASDGVWDCLSPEDAVHHVMSQAEQGRTAAEAAASLTQVAVDAQLQLFGSADNTSVGVLYFDPDLLRKHCRTTREAEEEDLELSMAFEALGQQYHGTDNILRSPEISMPPPRGRK